MKNDRWPKDSFGVIVLAGGKSSRMEFPKVWLPYNETQLFLDRIVQVYHEANITNIVIVLNHKFYHSQWSKDIERIQEKATIIQNNHPELERLYSINLGLKELETPFTFLHNVDNPFVEPQVISSLCDNVCSDGATTPAHNGTGGHPIIISSPVKKEIINNYNKFKDLRSILKKFNRKKVEVDCKSILANLNTPQEYQKAIYELV